MIFIGHIADLQVKNREKNLFNPYQKGFEDILRITQETQIPVLVISGDLFEYCEPNDSERKLIYNFLVKLGGIDTLHEIVIIAGNHDLPKFKKAQQVTEMDEDINMKENAINTFSELINLMPSDIVNKFLYVKNSGIYQSRIYPSLQYIGYSLEDGMKPDLSNIEDPLFKNKVNVCLFHAMLKDYAINNKLPLRKDIIDNLKDLSIFPDNCYVLAGDIHENLEFHNDRGVKFYYPGSTQEHTHNEGDFITFKDGEFNIELSEPKYVQIYNIPDMEGEELQITKHGITNYVHYITIKMSSKTAIADHLDTLTKWLSSQNCHVGVDVTYIKIKCSNSMKKHEQEVINQIRAVIPNAIISFDYDKVMKEVTEVSSKVVAEILQENKIDTEEENVDLSDINNLILTDEQLHRMFEYVAVQTIQQTSNEYLKTNDVKDDLLNIFKSQLSMVIDKGRRYDIELVNIKCNQFMALGSNDIKLDHSGIVRILGTNGIGKTTLFNMIRWVLTGTVFEGMKSNRAIQNNLVIFNKDNYQTDVVKVQLILRVNNTPICILRSADRKWKNNTTPEQKLSKNWKSYATCSTEVKVALHYKEENQKVLVGENAQANINAWFGDVIKNIMFVNSMTIDRMLKNDAATINELILNFIGVDYLHNLEKNIDTVKEELYVEKPKKTISEINKDIESIKEKRKETLKIKEENWKDKKECSDLVDRYRNSINEQKDKLIKIGDIPSLVEQKNQEISKIQFDIDSVTPDQLTKQELPTFVETKPDSTQHDNIIHDLEEKLYDYQQTLNNLEQEKSTKQEEKDAIIQDIKDNINQRQTATKDLIKSISDRNSVLVGQFKLLRDSIIQKFIEPTITKIEDMIKECETGISNLSTIRVIEDKIYTLKKDIETGVCSKCGRPFSDDYEQHKKQLELQITQYEKELSVQKEHLTQLQDRKKSLESKLKIYNNAKVHINGLSIDSTEQDINTTLELKIKDQYLSQQTSIILIIREYKSNNDKITEQTTTYNNLTELLTTFLTGLVKDNLLLTTIGLGTVYKSYETIIEKISEIQSNITNTQDSINKITQDITTENTSYNKSVSEYNTAYDAYLKKCKDINDHNEAILKIEAKLNSDKSLLAKAQEELNNIQGRRIEYDKVCGIIQAIEKSIKIQEENIEYHHTKDSEYAVTLNNLDIQENEDQMMITKALRWERNDIIYKVYSKIIKTSFKDIVFEYYRGYLNNTLDVLLSDVNFKLFWDNNSELSMISSNGPHVTYIPINQASGMETIFTGLALIYTISLLNIKHTTSHIFIDELSGQLNNGENISGDDIKNYQQLFVNILNKFKERTLFVVDHNIKDINENMMYEVIKHDGGNIYVKR